MKINLIAKAVLMVVVSSLLVRLFFYNYLQNMKAKTLAAESVPEQAIWRRNAESPANALLKEFVDGHITGTVTDDDGNALSGITVQVYKYYAYWEGWDEITSVNTESDGTYDVSTLNPGSYRVAFFDVHEIYLPEYYDNVTIFYAATNIELANKQIISGIDASLSEGGHITGIVTDHDGNALSGISVQAYQHKPKNDNWEIVTSVNTKSDGSYDVSGLNTGFYDVGFFDQNHDYAPEYHFNVIDLEAATPISATVEQSTSGIDASLSYGGHITGIVTDNNGNKLSDIEIAVYQYNPYKQDWYEMASAYSKADGSYDIKGLNTGNYRLHFSDENGSYLAEYYEDAYDLNSSTNIEVIAGENTSPINVSLTSSGHITGTVTDNDGNPLSDIKVKVYQYISEKADWGVVASASTNDDGSYDASHLNTGTYRIGFFNDYYYEFGYFLEYYSDAPNIESAVDISVTVGETTSGIDASLSSGGHITGTVTDNDGNPLSDIKVKVYQYISEKADWGVVASASTNDDGSYDVRLLNTGTYRVDFFSYGYISEYYSDASDLESADDVFVTIDETTSGIDASLSRGGYITGTVTDNDGNPLSGIRVDVYQYNDESKNWQSIVYNNTNSDGTYNVGRLNTGAYRVGFFGYDHDYALEYYSDAPDLESADDVFVAVDETTSGIDASLSDGGHITGTVTNRDGNPLSDIKVKVYQYMPESGDWHIYADSDTKSDGTYDVGALNTATYRVGFFDYDHDYPLEYYSDAPDLESAIDVSVTAGETTSGIDASLSDRGHITGTVTDTDGNALFRIRVQIYQSSSELGSWNMVTSVNTKSDGSYDVDGLNTGSYRVGFFDGYYNDYIQQYYSDASDLESAIDVSVTIGETTSGIDASLSDGGNITGTVTNRDGNSLSDIKVKVYQYMPESGDWHIYADSDTNDNGLYNVGRLNTDSYRVGFFKRNYGDVLEYYSDASNIESASDISVTIGETTSGINASLSESGYITGTVTDHDGNALPDIYVGVYQYNEDDKKWQWISSSDTMTDGSYDVGDLNTGNYRLHFFDDNGNYLPEYYLDAPNIDSTSNVSVTLAQSTANIDASLMLAAHITGIITDISGKPLPNIYVGAYQYQPEIQRWQRAAYAYSKADGTYDVGGLNTGSYRLRFSHRNYISEYYHNAPDLQSATELKVTAGESINNIHASLEEKMKSFLPFIGK